MIIETEAFTRFDDPRKFACHAGVAPFRYTSEAVNIQEQGIPAGEQANQDVVTHGCLVDHGKEVW
ncbi:MAG: transposase [Butyricimonas faecalis]